ncbi:TIGR03084 family metal-binding protein [Ilumatobacter nonamiensis]|uniref:TIGR03084 family metal-binding protein n=1 Tax=Ilumatobacter nonamiensis TaxID=467093 RepID=UPI00058AC449|nr:TIGR03084 family metal-binding protein [Ilumatobacter nonamiensis]
MTTESPTVAGVRSDLQAEQNALDSIVATLDEEQWALPTASPRWSVADQIAHLTYFDASASWAITDEERFRHSLADLAPLLSGESSPDDLDDATMGDYRTMAPAELLAAWRTNRRRLADAAETLDEDTRVIWYGPSMGAKSFLTARLMECWAHGQHIVDAVGAEREPTDRLRHIAQLGFITRKWTYVNRRLDAPATPIRVELDAPSGAGWTFGPDDAEQSVVGPALDFCLVVTQCRHVDATDLVVTGDDAREWMEMAQAFAGAATTGPPA